MHWDPETWVRRVHSREFLKGWIRRLPTVPGELARKVSAAQNKKPRENNKSKAMQYLGSDLVPALTGLQVHNFAHFGRMEATTLLQEEEREVEEEQEEERRLRRRWILEGECCPVL